MRGDWSGGMRPIQDTSPKGQTALLANASLDFRSAIAPARQVKENALEIGPETATALQLKEGDAVQFMFI